jgi:'Cold-shock' DNA-binding domain
VRALKQSFGFINCCERAEDVVFTFKELQPQDDGLPPTICVGDDVEFTVTGAKPKLTAVRCNPIFKSKFAMIVKVYLTCNHICEICVGVFVWCGTPARLPHLSTHMVTNSCDKAKTGKREAPMPACTLYPPAPTGHNPRYMYMHLPFAVFPVEHHEPV